MSSKRKGLLRYLDFNKKIPNFVIVKQEILTDNGLKCLNIARFAYDLLIGSSPASAIVSEAKRL